MLDILNQLSNTSSRLDKTSILMKNKSNETLKRVLLYALDPLRNFYMYAVPEVKTDIDVSAISIDEALTLLDDLTNRTVTGHRALAHVTDLFKKLNESDGEVIKRVIKKDLRCGVQRATVNKVWPGLIFEYPCLLAVTHSDKIKYQFPATAQIKSDGLRYNGVFDGKIPRHFGRSGKEIDLLGNLYPELEGIRDIYSNNFVIDGELLVLGSDGNPLPRKTGNGILNKAIKGTISKKEAESAIAVIWDIIPYEDFNKHICKIKYEQRFAQASDVISKLNSSRIRIAESRTVHNFTDIQQYYSEALLRNEEGIMVKFNDSYWENTRSPYLIKFKEEKECDLRVVGFNYGTPGTRTEHVVGSLILEDASGTLRVAVGSLTDDMRVDACVNFKTEWEGSIVSVKFNSVIDSINNAGAYSLFLPRIIEKRSDKTTPDSIHEIIAM